jgi:hypothetical protein
LREIDLTGIELLSKLRGKTPLLAFGSLDQHFLGNVFAIDTRHLLLAGNKQIEGTETKYSEHENQHANEYLEAESLGLIPQLLQHQVYLAYFFKAVNYLNKKRKKAHLCAFLHRFLNAY